MSRDVLGDLRGQLPIVGERRIAVRATPDAVRHLRAGDPWLFDGSITSVTSARRGERPAISPWCSTPTATSWRSGCGIPAHRSASRSCTTANRVQIDESFWRERITTALERRSTLAADPDTNAYRCVHGENDRLPSLVVDRYDRSLVVKLYSAIWFPHLAAVVATLCEALDPERVVLRLSRNVGKGATFGLTDGMTIVGPPPDGPVRFRERGLTLEADVVRGNKTGHFLDQRDNRALVRSMALGARVLDVFASTGGFSVAAAAGGATSVDLIDVSGPALRTAERNLAHNRFIAAVRGVHGAHHDRRRVRRDGTPPAARATLRPGRDRPTLVRATPDGRHERVARVRTLDEDRGRARRAGRRARAVVVLEPRDRRRVLRHACTKRRRQAGVELSEIRRTGHPLDHPIGFEHGAYLKTLYARVEPGRRWTPG